MNDANAKSNGNNNYNNKKNTNDDNISKDNSNNHTSFFTSISLYDNYLIKYLERLFIY